MSDPLVQELREAADWCDAKPYWDEGKPPAVLMLEAAEALDAAHRREQVLREALAAALDGWEDAAPYKGEYLNKEHRDVEDIAWLRAYVTAPQGEPR